MAASSLIFVYPINGGDQCGSRPLNGDKNVPNDILDPKALPLLLKQHWTMTAVNPSSCNSWLVQVQPPPEPPRLHHGPGPDPWLYHPRLVSVFASGASRLLSGDDFPIGNYADQALPVLLNDHWVVVGSLYLSAAGWLAWMEYHGVPKP